MALAVSSSCGCAFFPVEDVEPTLSDLEVDDFHFVRIGPIDDTLWICVNQDENGNELDEGHHISVINTGGLAASSYTVRLALRDEETGELWPFSDIDLTFKGRHEPNETERWTEPFCAELDVSYLPVVVYRTAVIVDVFDEVDEANEENNLTVSGELTFL